MSTSKKLRKADVSRKTGETDGKIFKDDAAHPGFGSAGVCGAWDVWVV